MDFIVLLLLHLPTVLGMINRPRYISNWVTMDGTDPSSLIQNFIHNFGILPVRCDIQVMAGPGTKNTGFVYPGVGSSHGDSEEDNNGNQRGGVICFYTDNQAQLVAASGNAGYIIHTGEKEWTVDYQQKSTQAMVRLRLWHPDDLPPVSANSSWFRMSSFSSRGIGSPRYKSWTHNLTMEPDFVSVQIKCQSNGTSLNQWVGEGQGSSMSRLPPSRSSDWGGLVFGFDNVEVRVWTPNNKGTIMSIKDGWGNYNVFGKHFGPECTDGDVRILVWKSLTPDNCTVEQDHNVTASENQTHEFAICNTIDLDKDLLVVQVQAIDGANDRFNFYGFGAAMTDFGDHFGGIVYAYNTSRVRIWHPRTQYLIYIDKWWGNSTNHEQMSTMAKVRIKVWKDNTITDRSQPITKTTATLNTGSVTSMTQSTTSTTQTTAEMTTATTTTVASTSTDDTTTDTGQPTTTTTATLNISSVTRTTQSSTNTIQRTAEMTTATTTTIASTSADDRTTDTGQPTASTAATLNIATTTAPRKKIYLVPCVKTSCNGKGTINTTELSQILSEISVSSLNTSKHIRSLTSAPDKRKSSEAVGIVGSIVLSVVLVLILSCDIARFVCNRMHVTRRHRDI